ncbi:hypothetical protein PGSY75_0202800 [Plasmodium gaboni]|uniref:RNA-binding protein n=1 Tax=Plasmodium gaboni TaxID=647221 RepID=A0A151LWE4_9APIC|nr:hypothetical protein PGSY75_0202800 [Plasmodium gaboni]KYO03462.1 hypothetical protein PGSY75_0202800 [Plasmodium gaboni]SOV10307.1 conserved Plasmodium protein, unknown function [Plasmodium gaboni]SOV20591.1 conserved Plasmodium protein, unknown function [Plasmodium sp. DRC-Itaito]
MGGDIFRLLPTEATGCLIRIKNISCFDKKSEVINFVGHLVEICLIHVDLLKNEAYVLLHSREEVLHFMKLYYVIYNNMHFIDRSKRNIEIEIFNEEKENLFWKESKKNCTKFNICCKGHK